MPTATCRSAVRPHRSRTLPPPNRANLQSQQPRQPAYISLWRQGKCFALCVLAVLGRLESATRGDILFMQRAHESRVDEDRQKRFLPTRFLKETGIQEAVFGETELAQFLPNIASYDRLGCYVLSLSSTEKRAGYLHHAIAIVSVSETEPKYRIMDTAQFAPGVIPVTTAQFTELLSAYQARYFAYGALNVEAVSYQTRSAQPVLAETQYA